MHLYFMTFSLYICKNRRYNLNVTNQKKKKQKKTDVKTLQSGNEYVNYTPKKLILWHLIDP